MKNSPRNTQYALRIAIPLLGALLIVALGIIIPLPPLVTGEESVPGDLAVKRVDAVAARYHYQEEMLNYEQFLGTHVIPGGLPSEMRSYADQLEAGADPATVTAEIKPRAQLALDLGEAMYPYAQASQDYFQVLQQYQDDLMTWSRTLGPRSEELRKATWPFIAWTQLYPEPVGTNTTIQFVPAENVRLTLESLRATVADLQQSVTPANIRRVAMAAEPLWDYGRSLPQYSSLHDGYFSALRQYDDQSVNVATTPEPPLSTTRTLLAWAGTLVIALLLLAGLLLLFGPQRLWQALPFRRTRPQAPASAST